MNMIFQNVRVILAVDSTMQGNDGTEIIPRYGCSNHHWSTSVFHCGKKAVRVVSFPGLPPHINSPCSWEKRKPNSSENITRFFLLVCRPALVISTPLLLNVDSGKQRLFDGGTSMISGLNELTANSFGWNWTIQMSIQLSSHIGGSSPTMRFNASRSLSVSFKVRPELLLLLEVFSVLLEFCHGPWYGCYRKPSSSTTLVPETPAIRAPTISHFSKSVTSRILLIFQ